MPTHTSSPAAVSAVDFPLDFWEHGPVRDLLETEFEMVLIEELENRDMRITPERERMLHDIVLPATFIFVAEQIPLTNLDRPEVFTVAEMEQIQNEIERLLGKELDHAASQAPESYRSPAKKASLWLGRALHRVFPI